jgi:hypothetical protein
MIWLHTGTSRKREKESLVIAWEITKIRVFSELYSNEYTHHKGIEGFIEDQAFSRSYDLAPLPPPPVSKLDLLHTERSRKRDNLLTGECGGEETG